MSGVSSQNRFDLLQTNSLTPSPSTSRPPSPKDTSPPLSPDRSLTERLKELSVSDECLYDAGRGFQCPDVSITAPTPSSSPTSSPDWRARSDDSSDSSPYKNFTRASSPPPRRKRTPVNPTALPGQLPSTFHPSAPDGRDHSPHSNKTFVGPSSPAPRRRRTPVNPAALPGQSHPLNPTSTPRHSSLPTLPPGLDLAVSNNQGHS